MSKICFCASSGGHYNQISQLKGLAGRHQSFVMTERTNFPSEAFCERRYELPMCSRRDWRFPFRLLYIALFALKVFMKECPDVVISTGAMATFPILLVGKLMGKRVIFIESLARVTSASLTGKLTYRFADLFIVRWPEMLKYYPNAVVEGIA